ncbi:hypothetical protein OLMES_5519 [Oleiphilus messinensis]|uniref:Uncharacterized protein n=1 Tax=Oleiphilus messinensis TaxID=141451 RepID=A0A1Y0IH84_9GAMM|nr:hypothetical protein OLMES_5519 [Oleiphilus messinensis]
MKYSTHKLSINPLSISVSTRSKSTLFKIRSNDINSKCSDLIKSALYLVLCELNYN